MKLALGTAQFGMDYGAFNLAGQVPRKTVAAILRRAAAAGIDMLDTARGYGSSELVLRDLAVGRFHVVTKCPPVADGMALAEAFEASARALGCFSIYGYLLHRADDLLGSEAASIWAGLERLRDSGRVQKIGVSAYGLDMVQAVVNRFPVSLVQIPANVLHPWFRRGALPESVEVHVRSVFLQGFLLGDPGALPPRLAPWRSTLELFRARAAGLGLTPLQATLRPLLQSPAIHRVIVGVDALQQLEEILAAASGTEPGPPADLGDYPHASPDLTDPREW